MLVGYLIILLVDRVIMHKLVGHGHHHHSTKEQAECTIRQEVANEAAAKAEMQQEI